MFSKANPCPACAKRKREDEEAEKVHQLKLSLFSQERYWLNDSEEEEDPTEELPYTQSQLWETSKEEDYFNYSFIFLFSFFFRWNFSMIAVSYSNLRDHTREPALRDHQHSYVV